MKMISFAFTVIENQLKFDDVNYKSLLGQFCAVNDGELGVVTFKINADEKTIPQLRFFHGVVVKAAARAMGELQDAETLKYVKHCLKDLFLRKYIEGREKYYIPSLSDMSKKDMSKFITDCINHIMYFLSGDFTAQEYEEYRAYQTWENSQGIS